MEKVLRFFERHGFTCLGAALFWGCAAAVFFPVLPKFTALIAPDSMPFFAYPSRTTNLEGLLAGGAFTPHNLYWLLLDPLYAHELTYMLDSFVLVLAGVYYLRSQRVHPLAAWFGGLALGLSGYTLTLFSAGHRGYFNMFSCAVWSFGLIARGFETKSLVHFALLGLVFAWGVPYQPDVLLLVGGLAAAYVLWRTMRRDEAQGRGFSSSLREAWRRVAGVWPRFLVSVLVLLLAGWSGIRSAVTTQIAGRDAQITRVYGGGANGGAANGKKTEAEKQDRWFFATGWSLPPEDVLEFLVPGVYGNDSGQMPYPYWGRLGRPEDRVFQKGRMMPNYRQHTVYLGVVSVIFALFAVVFWFYRRRHVSAVMPFEEAAAPRRPQAAVAADVPFWCVIWVVCLILAMGRYTPIYKVFYAIPYMDYIRAPVKFIHLAEVATAFLAGFGMDAFLRAEGRTPRMRALWVGAGTAILLSAGALVALIAKPAIVRTITELGMGQVAEALSAYTLSNFVRSVCLAALVSGLLAVAVRSSGRRLVVSVCCALLVLLAADQAGVAKRYVRAMDIAPLYTENAVVKALKKQAAGGVATVVNYVTPNVWGHDPFTSSLEMNGIRNRAPSREEMAAPYGQVFTGLQNDPVRLWQVVHAQAVVAPRKGLENMVRAGIVRPLLDFELVSGVVRTTALPGENTLTLARIENADPGPRFVTEWQGGVPAASQADALVKGARSVVSDAPSAPRASGSGASAVRVLASRGLPGAYETRVRVSAAAEGLLVFDERVADNREILVDGRAVTRHVADAVWPAALVPPGEHEVVLRMPRQTGLLAVSILTALAVSAWGVGVWVCSRRLPGAGPAA